jgi:hypothetical protein
MRHTWDVSSRWLPGGGRGGWFLWAATASLLAGCGQGAQTFVGTVEGTDAVVGAVTEDGQVTFYLCGGKTTFQPFTRWFSGAAAADGAFSLASTRNGTTFGLTGSLAAGSGTITTGTQTLSWSAGPVSGEMDGLYAAMNGSCRIGAVVGDLHGAGTALQGVWCEENAGNQDEYLQVTPITPIALTDQGIHVQVEGLPTAETLYVDRVLSP